MRQVLRRHLLSLCVGSLASCGYRVTSSRFHLREASESVGSKKDRPAKIFIPLVANETTRTGVEALLTNTLREAVGGIQGAHVAASEDEADYILLATLMDYTRKNAVSVLRTGDPTSEMQGGLLNGKGTARDILVHWEVHVEFLERQGSLARRRIWERDFTEEGSYNVMARFREEEGSSSLPQIHASREKVKLQGFSQAIARRVVDQMTQDF